LKENGKEFVRRRSYQTKFRHFPSIRLASRPGHFAVITVHQVNFLTRSFPQFVTAQAPAETASTSVGSLPVQDLRLNRGDDPITCDFIGHL
jgi:hypothetical protein